VPSSSTHDEAIDETRQTIATKGQAIEAKWQSIQKEVRPIEVK
jgi:hypothetical protein